MKDDQTKPMWPQKSEPKPEPKPSTITLADYKAHILGWHHGVSGQAQDAAGGQQYRAGFEVGRKTRNEYARALKGRVQ